MNNSETGYRRLRRWVFLAALLYGISIGLFAVPRVVGIVVPEVVSAVRTNADSTRQNSDGCTPTSCRILQKSRTIMARLWNDFQ